MRRLADRPSSVWRRTLCSMLAIGMASLPGPVLTEPIPASTQPVSITARNTELTPFLEQLFAQGGLRVQVSNTLRGRRINGRFDGTMAEVWDQVSGAFGLVGYYDRSVVRVYAAADVATRRYDDVDATALLAEVRRLRLTDDNNALSGGGTSVSASGVPAFLQQVGELASRFRAPAYDVAGQGTTGGAFISPLADPNAAGTATALAVRSEVLRAATVRQPYEVRIFFLRYASANDNFVLTGETQSRVPGLASILSGVMGDGRLPQTVRTSGDDFDRFAGVNPVLDLSDGDGLALVPTPDRRPVPESDPLPSRNVNGPRIEVDDTQNALIIRDRPEAMSVYEGIIAALDRPPRMVEIEAAIIDLNVDRLKDLGLDFNVAVDGLNVLFGGASSNPVPNFSSPNVTGSYVTDSGDSFAARITALERNGALSVVSRPQLITLDNRAALFDSTQELYIRVEGTLSRLERVSIGTMLRVTPAIIYDDGTPRVRLRIEIEDGAPTTSSVDDLPVLRRSRVSSQAVINQGESLLLGGITIDTSFEQRSKVPVLGDIPLFGQLFRKRRDGASRVERLFLLTPRIVEQGVPSGLSRQETIPLEALQGLSDAGDSR